MPSVRRVARLNQLIREELSKILDREVEFGLDCFVTITRVDISVDGHYAAVFVSMLAKDESTCLEILGKNTYYIQQLLNRKMRVRPVPKIKFVVDEGELKREGIEKSLAELKQKGDL